MSPLLAANGTDPERAERIVAGYAVAPFPAEAMDALVALAVRARLMGVVWTWQDTAAMHPHEREALLIAGEQAFASAALMAGEAASGPEGRAKVAEAIDGGAALAGLEGRQLRDAFRSLRADLAEAVRS